MRRLALAVLLLAPAAPAAAQTAAPVAGGFVSSKEWTVRRGASREEEFSGDVLYKSAGTKLTSDWALFKHADRSWQARGSIEMSRVMSDGAVVEAKGHRAGHQMDAKHGYLEPVPGGRVQFTRRPAGEEADKGEAGRVSWESESRFILSGGAKVWGPRLELAADEAVYERVAGRLTLNGGRPVLRKIEGEWTTAIKADETVATETPRRIESRGKVVGWLLFKDEKKLKELTK